MLKKQHTPKELSALSQKAIDSLLKRIHQEENCQTVLLYHSLPDEVETHQLIQTLAAEGKKVLLPTIAGTELELHEYRETVSDEGKDSTTAFFLSSTAPLSALPSHSKSSIPFLASRTTSA